MHYAAGKLYAVSRTTSDLVQVEQVDATAGKILDSTGLNAYCIGAKCELAHDKNTLVFYDSYSSALVVHQYDKGASSAFSLNVKV